MENTSPSLEALRKVIEAADTSRVTKKDFEELAKQIIELVKAIKTKNGEHTAKLGEMAQSTLSNVETRLGADLSEIKASLQASHEEMMNKMYAEHEAMMSECDAKMSSMKDGMDGFNGIDGEDGKDADEEAIVKRVLELIDVTKLKGMETIVKKYAPEPKALGASVIHKFMDDETPAGTVNGVNTVFTLVKYPVNGSLKVFRGGARQRVTEDYTLAGRTITFTIAPQVGEILLADYRYF